MLRTCIGEWPRGNEERRKRIPRAELLLEAARRLLEERPNIFVVSFSTVGDLLSQWRSYTPDHYGVMLQFDRGCIESRAEGQGFVLRPCDYTREDAGNIEGIPLFIDKFTKVDGDPLLAQQELKLLAAGLKHLAFHEEREVRLIHNDGRDTFEHEESRECGSILVTTQVSV